MEVSQLLSVGQKGKAALRNMEREREKARQRERDWGRTYRLAIGARD